MAMSMQDVWLTRKQEGVSILTMEAECTAASVVVARMVDIKELLGETGMDGVMPISLKVDNQAALNRLPIESSSKARHIDVKIKFVICYGKLAIFTTEYFEGSSMLADTMTKALHASRL